MIRVKKTTLLFQLHQQKKLRNKEHHKNYKSSLFRKLGTTRFSKFTSRRIFSKKNISPNVHQKNRIYFKTQCDIKGNGT